MNDDVEHEPEYWIKVTEDEVIDLAAGYTPKMVRANARMLLETSEDMCRRNAEKPAARKKAARPPREPGEAD